jgi:hypothetical protein
MNTTQAEQLLLLQAIDPYKEQRFDIEEHRVNLFKNILIIIRLQDIEKSRFFNYKFPTAGNILVLRDTHCFHHMN